MRIVLITGYTRNTARITRQGPTNTYGRPSFRQLPSVLLCRPARFDLVEDPLDRIRTVAHVVDHPGPEVARPDGRRHQVRRVEPGCPGLQPIREYGGRLREDVVRVAVRADVDVRGDAGGRRIARERALDVLGHEPLEEVPDLGTVPARPHHSELTSEE